MPTNEIQWEAAVEYTDGTQRAHITMTMPADASAWEFICYLHPRWEPAQRGTDGRWIEPTLRVRRAGMLRWTHAADAKAVHGQKVAA